MNLRNLFRRQQVENRESVHSIEASVDNQENSVAQHSEQRIISDESENSPCCQSEQLYVPCQNTQNINHVVPWIVRDAGTFSHE